MNGGVANTSGIKIRGPKKISLASTKPLLARRLEPPTKNKGDWNKLKKSFSLLKPSVRGNRFLY